MGNPVPFFSLSMGRSSFELVESQRGDDAQEEQEQEQEQEERGESEAAPLDPTPLPPATYVLVLMQFVEGVSISILFPFVGYMVQDFKLTDDRTKVGYYAGALASAFSFAQLLSAVHWGRLSDRIGRRPVLLMGLCGTCINTILFGLSRAYWWAVTARALGGLSTGNIGVSKTMMAEITDATNQTKGFTHFSTAWGIGAIVGPLLGGLLARPVVQYPSTFPRDSFWSEFPYVLPCFCSAFITFVGFVMGLFLLPESRAERRHEKRDPEVVIEEDDGLAKEEEKATNTRHVPCIPKFRRVLPFTRLRDEADETINHTESSALRDKYVLLTTFLYGAVCFNFIVFDEVFPVWAINSVSDGGLNFQPRHLGIIMGVGGVSLVLIQRFLYPRIVVRLRLVRTFRLGLLVGAFLFLFPFLNVFGSSFPLTVSFTLVAIVGRQLAASLSFVSVMMLVNNACPCAWQRGKINGFGQSLAAASRALGPTLGGICLAWSLGNGLPFPLDFHFPFFLVGCLFLGSLGLSFRLPFLLDLPRV